jgi:hypothetical protein
LTTRRDADDPRLGAGGTKTNSFKLIHANSAIRQPWVFDGVVEFGWNRPTLDEGWNAFEREMLPTCTSLAKARIPEWREQLKAAREPLFQRAPDLAAQLELFVDLDFDYSAGCQFLRELRDQRGVQDRFLVAFIESVGKAREVKTFGCLKRDSEIAQALDEFRRAKAVIMAEIRKHDGATDSSQLPLTGRQNHRLQPADRGGIRMESHLAAAG